jgi:hypothetical protein
MELSSKILTNGEFFMKATVLTLAFVLLVGGIARAGDYYVYQDATGRTWLSNQSPPNKDDSPERRPDDVTIIKKYQWQDVTDEQLAASAAAQRELAQLNLMRDQASNTEWLINELGVERIERLEPSQVNEPIIVVQTTRPRRFSRPSVTARAPMTKARR